jgi:hypothetical protein
MKTIKYSFLFFLFCSVFTNSMAQSSDADIERKIIENLRNNLPAYAGMEAVHTFGVVMDKNVTEENLSYQTGRALDIISQEYQIKHLSIKHGQEEVGYVYITCRGDIEWGDLKLILSKAGFSILNHQVEYSTSK